MARGLDHLVIAVRDLDAAGRYYERLGFQVGSRNRHPWGTENRLVQFPGSFLELVTVGRDGDVPGHDERAFSFGAFVRDYLARREGLAMLVLDSQDARSDAAHFAATGIADFEPFFFERHGRRPDGTETLVAFTLAFARHAKAEGIGFFVCQQHYPENFWNEAFQRHPNGATGVSAVVLAAPQPAQLAPFLAAFTGATPTEPATHDLSFALPRGHLDVMTPDDAAEVYASIEADPGQASLVAFSVRIENVERQSAMLTASGIPFLRVGSRLIVPSSAAFGVAVAFEPAIVPI